MQQFASIENTMPRARASSDYRQADDCVRPAIFVHPSSTSMSCTPDPTTTYFPSKGSLRRLEQPPIAVGNSCCIRQISSNRPIFLSRVLSVANTRVRCCADFDNVVAMQDGSAAHSTRIVRSWPTMDPWNDMNLLHYFRKVETYAHPVAKEDLESLPKLSCGIESS